MALPNDSHSSATTGTTFATHLVSGKEYPVGLTADSDGQIRGSLPAFGLTIPPAAVAANKVFFDLHTTTSRIRLRKLFAVVATDVAVTGVVGARLDVMRTSTVGTGGTTALTTASASKTVPTIWAFDGTTALATGITSRAGTTGGATDEQWLFPTYAFTEETSQPAQVVQFYNLLPELSTEQTIELAPGKGLKVVQGSVASVGSLAFFVVFTVE